MADCSLQEIKEKLKELGISTSTPGLQGKDRHEELLNRLESALTRDASSDINVAKDEVYVVPSFSNISIAEAKSRLAILGEVRPTCHTPLVCDVICCIEYCNSWLGWRKSSCGTRAATDKCYMPKRVSTHGRNIRSNRSRSSPICSKIIKLSLPLSTVDI